MCEQAKGKEKCERIRGEEYEKQTYVSDAKIEDVRGMYRTRFKLLPFAGNYSHDKKFSKSNWLRKCKGAREEEGHIVSGNCTVYSDLRSHFGDLGEDQNLVNFFRAVLDRRDALEEEDRTGSL